MVYSHTQNEMTAILGHVMVETTKPATDLLVQTMQNMQSIRYAIQPKHAHFLVALHQPANIYSNQSSQ